jgi:hypothetical protein
VVSVATARDVDPSGAGLSHGVLPGPPHGDRAIAKRMSLELKRIGKLILCFVVGHDWRTCMLPVSEEELREHLAICAPIKAAWEAKKASPGYSGPPGKPAPTPPRPSPTYFEQCRRCKAT